MKRIIPCLDVCEGRVVKGVNFVDLKDAGDPAEFARFYSEEGADEVTFLDIMATYEKRDTIIDVVSRTAEAVTVPLTVGGGIRTVSDFRKLLNAGASKISVNSAAFLNPALLSEAAKEFGSKSVVLAIDAQWNEEGGYYEVFLNGGRQGTGMDAAEWARRGAALGAGEILVTSIHRDGTKEGYDLPLTDAIARAASIPVIASGGVGSLSDFSDVFEKTGADAALCASLFHFRELSIMQVKTYLNDRGIPVSM